MSENPIDITPATNPSCSRNGWSRFQFSLGTLLLAVPAVGLLADYVVLERNEKHRVRQEANLLNEASRINHSIRLLNVPDEVLYGDKAVWRKIAHLRHDSFERHGIERHLNFGNVLQGSVSRNSGEPVLPGYWGSHHSSFERSWPQQTANACNKIAYSLERKPEFWRKHPELFARRIRPLLVRLLQAETAPEVTVAACRAMLASGDRTPETLAALQHVLDLPNELARSVRGDRPEFVHWYYPFVKKAAIKVNEEFQLGLRVLELPGPAGVECHPVLPAVGPVATWIRDAPLLASYADRDALAAEIARRFKSALIVHSPAGREFEVDPIQYPNSALLVAHEYTRAKLVYGAPLDANTKQAGKPRELTAVDFYTSHRHLQFRKHSLLPGHKATLELWAFTGADVFKFKATDAGRSQQIGAISVVLNSVNNNVAGGKLSGIPLMTTAPERVHFFAFDRQGNALKLNSMSGGGGDSPEQNWFVDFHGTIDEIWVAVPRGLELLRIPVTIDSESLVPEQVPAEPDPNVRRRYVPRDTLKSLPVDAQAFQNYALRLEPGWSRYQSTLLFGQSFSKDVTRAAAEIVTFDGESPVDVFWSPSHLRGRLIWPSYPRNYRGDHPRVHAVFGRIRVQCMSTCETIPFTKAANGAWTQTKSRNFDPASPVDFQVSFNHQIVTLKGPPADDLKLLAFDETGRQLKLDRVEQPADGDSTRYFFWGSPTRCEVVVTRILDRVVPFEFKLGELDEEAYAAYKQHVEDRRPMLNALLQIGIARSDKKYGNFQPLAALHFLHNASGEEINLIPREIALACRNQAETFDYEPVPYHGYFFELCGARVSSGDSSTQAWAGGKIALPRSYDGHVYAIPVDSQLPTYVYKGRRQIRQRWLNGGELHDPGWDLEKAGWTITPYLDNERLFKP